MNKFQRRVTGRTKYLTTILPHRSFYFLRKWVRKDYRNWSKGE